MTDKTIKIDVVSDIACPWCYVGKHRFETAIKEWKGSQIEVNWRPYILNPGIPKEGWNRETYLQKKFGTSVRPEAMNRITDAGKEEGIDFNFGEKWLGIDTFPLHKLMHVAGIEGFKSELKERFFYAYFTENLHLNQPDVLNTIMAEFGWDVQKTQRILKDTEIETAVHEEIEYYQRRGVSGVPFFIINDKYGISGAQPSDVFLQAFTQILKEELDVPTGEHCDPSSGDC